MTTIANIVRDGLLYKHRGVPSSYSSKRSADLELGSVVVDAIDIYDMPRVARLLKVGPDRPKTFGNEATRR